LTAIEFFRTISPIEIESQVLLAYQPISSLAKWILRPMNSHGDDNLLCRCLQVRRSTVIDCIAVTGAETVREIAQHTGAGSGCNACHCRIRELLACRTSAVVAVPVTNR
jgi:NAD(P)H-nitrite reductase large subunit